MLERLFSYFTTLETYREFHFNVSRAVSMLFQEIKMCPESLESSGISLDHNLQVAMAFFFDIKGR